MVGVVGDRPRMPSAEVWVRALAAVEAAARAESREAVPLVVEETLAELTASELTRVAMVLAALASDHVPRHCLPRGKRAEQRVVVLKLVERLRLEVAWQAP